MDVFEIGHQFGDSDFQLNDHNPAISENGLVWTMSIPHDSVTANLEDGEAAFCLSDAQMPDQGNLLTSLWGGGLVDGEDLPLLPVFPSTVALDAHWFSPGKQQRSSDVVNRFVYDYVSTKASIKWKSFRRGAMFESDAGSQQVLFAAIGVEKNGEFFEKDLD